MTGGLLALFALTTTYKLGFVYEQIASSWAVESRAQFKLAIRHINERGVLPFNTTLSYVAMDAGYSSVSALAASITLLEDPDMIGLVGTGLSTNLVGPAMYATTRGKPIVSPASTSTDLMTTHNLGYMFRTISNNARQLEEIIALLVQLGLVHIAVVYDHGFDSTAQYFGDLARAAGLEVHLMVEIFDEQTAPVTEAEESSFDATDLHRSLQLVVQSGARIIISITELGQRTLQRVANEVGLHTRDYAWLGVDVSMECPDAVHSFLNGYDAPLGSFPPMRGYLYPEADFNASWPPLAAYNGDWVAAVTRYDPAVHGQFNETNGAPFYDEAHEEYFFDTAGYADVRPGDGLVDAWGRYAYDTAWIYAYAIANLSARGISALDGAALRAAIFAIDMDGVTGRVSFDLVTQDRVEPFVLKNLQSDAPPDNLTAPCAVETIGSRGYARAQDFDVSSIQWRGDVMPNDGSSAEGSFSYVEWLALARQGLTAGSTLGLRVFLRNAFQAEMKDPASANVTVVLEGGDLDGSVALRCDPNRVNYHAGGSVACDSNSSGITLSQRDYLLTLTRPGTVRVWVSVGDASRVEFVQGMPLEIVVLAVAEPDTALYDAVLIAGVCLFVFFVVMSTLAYVRIKKQRNKEQLRLSSTGRPPELVLGAGEKWHLFLSHSWASGQDQVHTIRASLRRMLPQAEVFLDIESLEDIGKIEEYVEQSSVILMFLSRGYFKSTNCLREVRASVELGKVLCLVHEANVSRGGDKLDNLIEECPEELRSSIFTAKRHFIPYLRQPQFQIESLIEICKIVVRSTSSGHRAAYVSGHHLPAAASELELTSYASILHAPMRPAKNVKQVQLFFSHDNLGARQLATELQKGMPEGYFKLLDHQDEVPQLGESYGQLPKLQRLSRSLDQSEMSAIDQGAASTQLRISKASPRRTSQKRRSSWIYSTVSQVSEKQKRVRRQQQLSLLLLLNEETFVGEAGKKLAVLVRRARENRVPILMVHDTRVAFDKFFESTPHDLVLGGLYKDIAMSLYPTGPHHAASLAEIHARWFGAHEGEHTYMKNALKQAVLLPANLVKRNSDEVIRTFSARRQFGSTSRPPQSPPSSTATSSRRAPAAAPELSQEPSQESRQVAPPSGSATVESV